MRNDEMSGCLKGQPFVVTGEVILYGENKERVILTYLVIKVRLDLEILII